MAGISGKVAVITGASSGIGEATAQELARRGATVVLGARRADRIEALAAGIAAAGGTAIAVPTDVTDIEAVRRLTQRAIDAFGKVDVFVNNAGVMPLSPLDQLKVDEWNTMIDVNIRGVLHGIAAALPHFKARRSGQFVNVSSIGGRVAVATGAVYCATKFAVHAISEALRQEVGGDIRVTIVAPGVVESDLASTITDPSTQQFMADFRRISIPPDAIARAIAFAVEQPDDVDVSELIVRPTASAF
jgi:NADP-dependent 3-hydroxy acid dehydrogenase YdfG